MDDGKAGLLAGISFQFFHGMRGVRTGPVGGFYTVRLAYRYVFDYWPRRPA